MFDLAILIKENTNYPFNKIMWTWDHVKRFRKLLSKEKKHLDSLKDMFDNHGDNFLVSTIYPKAIAKSVEMMQLYRHILNIIEPLATKPWWLKLFLKR